jgi:predicted DNA-binding ribbon-helix-helix protein
MKSPIVKRSICIAGHNTSVSLEDAFWKELREIAAERHMKLSELARTISIEREKGNLSSAIRLFVLEFHRNRVSAHYEKQTGNRVA